MHDPSFLVEAPPIVYWNSNPYAIVFSPEGRRLAIGAGGWYGLGGIAMIDVESLEGKTLRFLPPDSGGEASVLPQAWGEPSRAMSPGGPVERARRRPRGLGLRRVDRASEGRRSGGGPALADGPARATAG